MLDSEERDLLRAFEQRAYARSEAGQFEQDEERRRADERQAQHAAMGSDWLRGLGLGDTVPSPDDYDYGRMLSEGVYPKPDEQGRLPLPPRYFKPGRLVLDGLDVATGRRVESRVSLEDRVLADGIDLDGDGVPDIPLAALGRALDGEGSELTPAERRSLSAWFDSQRDPEPVQLAMGSRGRPGNQRVNVGETLTDAGTGLLDMLAGALKGATAATMGLPGDIESLVRMLSGSEGGQVMPTTEDMQKVIPPVATDPVRAKTAGPYETIGEFMGLGTAPKAMRAVIRKAPRAAAAAAAGAPANIEADKGMTE